MQAEVEAVAWFDRDEAKSMLVNGTSLRLDSLSKRDESEASLMVPGPYAIAHHLVKKFIDGEYDRLFPPTVGEPQSRLGD